MIYFDNSATTKPSEGVVNCIMHNLNSDEVFGNPGSLHKLGLTSDKFYKTSIKNIAKNLGASESEVYFTSCGTEGSNTAILGYMNRNSHSGKTIISTKTEHKATLETLNKLQNDGFTVKYVSVDMSGKPVLSELAELIDSDTALMCFTHVNNESGSILPIDEIVKIRNEKNRNCAIFLDCVQSLGKLKINVKSLGVEMASFSGHKIHSVKGVGVLYVKNGVKINPYIIGGGQQNGMRSGTQSLLLAQAFDVALDEAEKNREAAYKNVAEINSYLREELVKRDAIILSPDDALPFVLNVSFKGFESETMLHCLEGYNIFVSTVSACSSKTKKVSYVLLEMGVDRKVAANSVRLSFSRYNTMDEAREFIETVDKIYDLFLLK